MKKRAIRTLSLLAVAGLLVYMAGAATAAGTSAASKDENKLNAAITMINSDANLPQGDNVIAKQLTDSFNVKSDKVSSLLGKNMQYGDIAAILAFADKMPGGVTDANINQVVNMRSKAAGWDQLAKSLNVNIGDVASKINSIEDGTHKNIKQALAESFSSGRAAGGVEQPSGGIMGQPSEGIPGEATGGTGTAGEATGGTGTVGGATGGTEGGTTGGPSGGPGGGGY